MNWCHLVYTWYFFRRGQRSLRGHFRCLTEYLQNASFLKLHGVGICVWCIYIGYSQCLCGVKIIGIKGHLEVISMKRLISFKFDMYAQHSSRQSYTWFYYTAEGCVLFLTWSSCFLLSTFTFALALTCWYRFWPNLVTTIIDHAPTCHVKIVGSKVTQGS